LRQKGCAQDSVHAYYSGSWGWRDCNSPYAIAYGNSSLWAIDNGRERLVRIDPRLHSAVDQVDLPGSGWGIAISGTTAWVSGNEAANSLYQVDLRQRRVVATIGGLDNGTAAVAADSNAVWVLCARAGTGHLDRVDPTTGRVTARYPMEWWSPTAVADAGAVYVRGTFGSDISRINAGTGAVEWQQPGPGFLGPAGIDQLGLTKDGIWMSGPSTVRIDPKTGQTLETLRTTSASVAAAPNELWLVLLDGSVAAYKRS
jgi:sugar lactone lactonase YvrE